MRHEYLTERINIPSSSPSSSRLTISNSFGIYLPSNLADCHRLNMNHFYPKRTIMFRQSPYRCSCLVHTSRWQPICCWQYRSVLSSGTGRNENFLLVSSTHKSRKSIKASSSCFILLLLAFLHFLDDDEGAALFFFARYLHLSMRPTQNNLCCFFGWTDEGERILSSKINYN